MLYDTIIIGAGPSGSILAYDLAQRGLRVLLIEKEQLPRYKTCGGGLPLKTVRAIPFDLSAVFELVAQGGELHNDAHCVVRVEVQRPFAWLVMRDAFDNFLAQQAAAAGAEVIDRVTLESVEQNDQEVRVSTSRGAFRASVLAGADGVNSRVARCAGLLQDRAAGTAIEAEVSVPPERLAQLGPYAAFDFGVLKHGYGWIFPKREHFSIGLFYAQPDKAPGLKPALSRYLTALGLENSVIKIEKGHRIPLGGRKQPLHAGRILLIGDAANLADPWLGEGIYYAVRSARIAAEEISAQLQSPGMDLSGYSRRVNQQIVQQLRQAGVFARQVYDHPQLGIRLVSGSAKMQELVFGAMRGDFTFSQMNRGLLRHMLLILKQVRTSQRGV